LKTYLGPTASNSVSFSGLPILFGAPGAKVRLRLILEGSGVVESSHTGFGGARGTRGASVFTYLLISISASLYFRFASFASSFFFYFAIFALAFQYLLHLPWNFLP